MTSAIRARRSLALLAAAAVVAAGLALSPAIASPAHASTTTSTVAKILKKINSVRANEGLPKFARNAFLDKFAAEVAHRVSIGKTGESALNTKDREPDGASDLVGLPLGVHGGSSTTARINYLIPLYGSRSDYVNRIQTESYNYAAAGFVIKGKQVFSVVILAEYDTPPLDLLVQGTPKISGRAAVGATLTAKTASKPSGSTYTYSWRYGTTVLGTASTYVPTAADLGHKITVTTIASKDGYRTTAAKKSLAVKIARGTLIRTKPVVSGSRNVGQVLTATVSPWGPGTVTLTYQWLRNGKAIKTTGLESSYTLVAADKGKLITVAVTGHESGFTAASATTTTKTKVGPALP
jgi:hypothetical protein